MTVEFNPGGVSFIPVIQTSPRPTPAEVSGDDTSFSFSIQSLSGAIKLASQVRSVKMAQANALLSEGDYPSDEDLDRLAGFLAGRL